LLASSYFYLGESAEFQQPDYKSHTESKLSKTSLGLLCTRGIVVVHLYCGFSMWRQMAAQQTAKFRTAFFGQFFLPV